MVLRDPWISQVKKKTLENIKQEKGVEGSLHFTVFFCY